VGRKGKGRMVVTFLLPAVVMYAVFFVYPAIKALYVSLHNWSGFTKDMEFVGLANFKELFTTDVFWIALGNNVIILFGGGALIFIFALLFAAILSNKRIHGRKFFRGLFFFPNLISAVAVAVLWSFIYNERFGMINSLLRAIGLDSLTRTWLGTRPLAMGSIIVVMLWMYMGYYMVLLLSGIDKIPDSYYDAARVEGASGGQIFFQITLPLIWDVLIIALNLWAIGALKSFELIWAMTQGGPGNATQVISTYMYGMAFGERYAVFRMGYGTAIAVVLLILVMIGSALIRKLGVREAVEF
jgi:ABC-type sugar transport system permease subunit